MNREQRLTVLFLVTLALLAVWAVTSWASHVTGTVEPVSTPLAESAFRDVAPTSRPAVGIRPVERVDLSALPGAGTSPRPPEAPQLTRDPQARGQMVAGASPRPAATRASEPAAGSSRLRSGVASWYPASGLIGAVHSWHWGDTPYPVVLTTIDGGRAVSITVLVADYCDGCTGSRLIDLSDDAFRRLAPLDAGLVRIQAEGIKP